MDWMRSQGQPLLRPRLRQPRLGRLLRRRHHQPARRPEPGQPAEQRRAARLPGRRVRRPRLRHEVAAPRDRQRARPTSGAGRRTRPTGSTSGTSAAPSSAGCRPRSCSTRWPRRPPARPTLASADDRRRRAAPSARRRASAGRRRRRRLRLARSSAARRATPTATATLERAEPAPVDLPPERPGDARAIDRKGLARRGRPKRGGRGRPAEARSPSGERGSRTRPRRRQQASLAIEDELRSPSAVEAGPARAGRTRRATRPPSTRIVREAYLRTLAGARGRGRRPLPRRRGDAARGCATCSGPCSTPRNSSRTTEPVSAADPSRIDDHDPFTRGRRSWRRTGTATASGGATSCGWACSGPPG